MAEYQGKSGSKAKPHMFIDDEAQKKLYTYIQHAAGLRNTGWQNRARFEEIDRSYMRTNDFTEEGRKAKRANRAGDVTKIQNMQVPMVLEATENAVGFLSNVFLLEYPMFKFGSDPNNENLALMWNTLVGEDQIHYGWISQFNIAFRNGEKYNFSPIEVDWCEEKLYKVANGNGKNGANLEQIVWAGNKIMARDPYNTIYDTRVPIYRCHIDGEFIGYMEDITRIQLKLFLASLGDRKLKNDRKAFESGVGNIATYIPRINEDSFIDKQRAGDSFDWTAWITDEASRHIKYKNMYTKVVLYARIMAYEFGINAPKDQTPEIWKLVSINDVIVYAEPMENAHNLLPMVIAQTQVDNLDHQTKTPAENQMPFQAMTSALWNAELNIARRAAVDRMLYNPLLVDPDHINSPNPGAKIPLRPTAYGRKLEEAVYKIPFEGNAGGMYISAANGVAEWGMRAGGNNRVSLGQFQKGNKLQDEFQTTMANAGTRERTKAIMWEGLPMYAIKTILKSNYAQFTPKGTRYNRTEEKAVDIDPVELRKTEANFMVGDGLLPIEKLMHADVAQGALQALGSNPAIGQGYEVAPLFSYLMKLQGADKLEMFEKNPEMLAYGNLLSQWTNAAIELAKAKPAITVEDYQKLLDTVIGPKPQPPKQPGQPQQTLENPDANT